MNSPDGIVILSDRLARRLFPGQDPIGHSIKPAGSRKPSHTVVGVAADVKNAGLTAEDAPEVTCPTTARKKRRVSCPPWSAALPGRTSSPA